MLVFTICMLWAFVIFGILRIQTRIQQDTIQQSLNIAIASEDQVAHLLRSIDQTLLYARDAYIGNPDSFDIAEWTRSIQILTDLSFQIVITDRNGNIIFSNTPIPSSRINVGDREHFLVQRDPNRDEMFISVPIVGRLSRRPSINLTGESIGRDGTFAGNLSGSRWTRICWSASTRCSIWVRSV